MKIQHMAQSEKKYKAKILQFGEGNFLRAFVDWMIDYSNKSKGYNTGITVVQPIANGTVDLLNNQKGFYSVIQNGIRDNVLIRETTLVEAVINGIDPYKDFDEYLETSRNMDYKFIVSNTTEAGIVFKESDRYHDAPPSSFPAKLTRWLYERYKAFNGKMDKGVTIIPCELIDKNGEKLRKYVLEYVQLWELEPEFLEWIQKANTFCNTLVDRIVPGYPRHRLEEVTEMLGYEDQLIVESEPYYLWVIEADEKVQGSLPLDRSLNVLYTDDLTPYRMRKVRLLNGPHTCMVPVGILYGLETVKEAVEDIVIGKFIQELMFDEIIPAINMDMKELKEYANEVLDRFRNPFVKHKLISISLNSNSKYHTRVLPTLKDYFGKTGALPKKAVFALAATIRLFKGEVSGSAIELKDDPDVLEMYSRLWKQYEQGIIDIHKLVVKVLSNEELWFEDLNQVDGLTDLTVQYLQIICEEGIHKALEAMM